MSADHALQTDGPVTKKNPVMRGAWYYSVDLVRAGVVEVLALEEDARAPGMLREARGLRER